ncbi:MAG: DUF2817 domain-containing protein [Planctomycetota bacterium]|jgi:protein MpaA
MITLICGCQPAQQDRYAPQILTPQLTRIETLGYSVQGRPIELITMGHGPAKTMIIATVHGNEEAGTPLVAELQTHLRQRRRLLEANTVMIVPVANPDGMAMNTRGNANRVDLNRNFPAANRINNETNGPAGLSEPESKILHDLILREMPDRIVSLHQPLDCIDYDGPGQAIAERMGQYCDLPVNKLGGRPGSMGSFVGIDQNIPIITVEMLRSDSDLTSTQLWQKYGVMLLSAITYPNLPY